MKFIKNILLFGIITAFLLGCNVAGPVETVKSTIGKVTSSSSDKRYGKNAKVCLVRAMYFEARGTGERGMRAVGEVLLNRSDDPRFPNSVCGVLEQRYNGSCQFSFVCDGTPDRYREPAQKALAEKIALTLLTNRGEDITNGALFFHARTINPGWFKTLRRIGRFGGNIFYK